MTKAKECIGMNRRQLMGFVEEIRQGHVIMDLMPIKNADLIEWCLESESLKACSVHPGFFITDRWTKEGRARRAKEKAGEN